MQRPAAPAALAATNSRRDIFIINQCKTNFGQRRVGCQIFDPAGESNHKFLVGVGKSGCIASRAKTKSLCLQESQELAHETLS
jgi:hypothetical protein